MIKKVLFSLIVIHLLFVGCKNTVETPAHTHVVAAEKVISKPDVNHFVFDQLPLDTISEGITRRWFYGEKGQMAIFYMEKGAHIPWHKHPNEQITYIMEGKVKIKTIIDGKETMKIVSGGEVIVFPENVPHEFWALEKTVDLDVHVPVRQDWLSDELPDYLKNSK